MKKLRLLLFPFGFLYGIITAVRNWLFDLGIKKTYIIPVKSICVGNLSVGGTGKTPHVAYLASLLKQENNVQILSRGYGRKTRGFILLDEKATSQTVGDEPLFYHKNFPDVTVAVCESRKDGIEKLLEIEKESVILLDDAFQHRAVKAGLNIILTDYSQPYYNDLMLPAGNLREWTFGKKRADIVIVTKSPENLDESAKEKIRKKLKFEEESIFFSKIKYGALVPFQKEQTTFKNVLLVTGIANPFPLEKHLKKHFNVELLKFPDHHEFTLDDIQKIHKKFGTFASENKAIVTTEKDFMRLNDSAIIDEITQKPWFYQAITVEIDRENDFKSAIKDYVRTI